MLKLCWGWRVWSKFSTASPLILVRSRPLEIGLSMWRSKLGHAELLSACQLVRIRSWLGLN